MRARHRHLNQRHAGAGIVLDARYIDQTNNSEVSAWIDRSGNGYNASQAIQARRPTFQFGEAGGNPIVRFDGGDDQLTIQNAAGYLRNVNYGLLFAVIKDRLPTSGPAAHRTFKFTHGGSATAFRLGLNTRVGGANNFHAGARRLDADGFVSANSVNNGNYNILAALGDYGNGRVSIIVNNITTNTTNLPAGAGNTSDTNSQTVIVGGTINSTADSSPSDYALLLAFNSRLSDALSMKIHRSAALTYKLPCN
jgi:hypothetical protein